MLGSLGAYDVRPIRSLTQEDPLGLAGGLNLYGFAEGDPVTFSDPFGLCQTEAGDTTKTVCPAPSGSSDSFQATRSQNDPCNVYANSSILKGICESAYGPQSDSATTCAARCLAVLYDDLDLEQGKLNMRSLVRYLFRGHSACYGKCDYSFWKDFLPGLLSGSGLRGRPRNIRITTATERIPSCMMTGGCLRD